MFRFQKAYSMPITKILAKRFCDLKRVPGERPLNTSRLVHLEKEIESGKLITFRWVLARMANSDDVYRINGQHTSHLFLKKPERDTEAVAVIEEYECDSLEDVRALWSRFDDARSSRSSRDIIRAIFDEDEEFKDLSINHLRLAVSAASIVSFGHQLRNISSYDRAISAKNHGEWIRWICNTITQKDGCFRVGVMVASLLSYQQDSELATMFWDEVQRGTNPDPKSASRALQRYLLKQNDGKKHSWEETASVSYRAWQLWIEGKQVSNFKAKRDWILQFTNQNAKFGELSVVSAG